MHNTSWTAAGVVALAGVWLGRPADGPRARRLALLAVGCWLAGQVVWDVWALAGARPGVPSPADLFWLGSAVISLWIVHSGPSGDGAWRTLARLDLAAILVGSVALSSVLLYADLERSELAVPGLMTAVAYPALYGAVAVKLAHRMSASAFRAPGVLLVLVGLASEAVAFSLRAPLLLDGATTSSDTAIDVLAPLGLVLIGCGAALTRREAAAVALSSERRERATLRGGAAPGIAFAALLLSLPILALEAQPLGQRLIAQGAVIALGAILALRFTMLSVRHLRLAERERVAREEAQRSSAARRVLEQERERSRVEAELANLAKSEFMSRMSHELRTPLNAILGFGQILEMDGPEAADPENVRHILRGGRHLLELVDEILDISRIE
jgi:signal transduction histidine kinase